LLAALLGLAVVLWMLSPILAPFLAAAILAYILDPLVSVLEGKGLPRAVGAGLAVVALLLAVVVLLLIVMPVFYKEITQLVEQLPTLAEQLKTRFVPWLRDEFGIAISLDPSSFRQFVAENLSSTSEIAKKLFSSLSVGGLAVLGFLINLLLIPLVLFYLLRDWTIVLGHVDKLVPRQIHPTLSKVAKEIDAVLSEFLRGQVSVMLIMAVYYATGLWLVGLDFALPVGLITGLLVFVPYLGSGTGLVLGTVAAVMQFPSANGVALVWAVFGAGQVIEGLVVTPWLVGNRIGLHPVAVIFSLLAFGQIFGFFGLLLALPASAAILVGLRHLRARYQTSALYSK
jgi:predicted PurR-regulated permease PerM